MSRLTRDFLIATLLDNLDLLQDDPELDGRPVNVRHDGQLITIEIGYNTLHLKILDDMPRSSRIVEKKKESRLLRLWRRLWWDFT